MLGDQILTVKSYWHDSSTQQMAVMVQKLSFKGMTQGLRSEDVYSEDNSIFVPVVALQLLFFRTDKHSSPTSRSF